MKLLRELKIYRMEEIDDISDSDEEYGDYEDDLGDDNVDDELEPAASGPDPDEQDMMGDDELSDDEMLDDDQFDDISDDDMSDEFSDDEDEFGGEDDQFGDGEDELDGEDGQLGDEEPQDQNYQGNVRSIPGTFLVYKREAEDSTFEELWLYNVGKDIKHEMKLRRAILSGTDISPQTGRSKDGKQTAKITSLGNVQFLNVFGVPN